MIVGRSKGANTRSHKENIESKDSRHRLTPLYTILSELCRLSLTNGQRRTVRFIVQLETRFPIHRRMHYVISIFSPSAPIYYVNILSMISIRPLCLLFSAFHWNCLSIWSLCFPISPITPKSMMFYDVESCNWKPNQLDGFKQPKPIQSRENPWNFKTKLKCSLRNVTQINSSVRWIMIHNRQDQRKWHKIHN